MPQVTCPRCGTRQPLADGADGYTCASCGASWMFAACENCGVRFHMRPGTTDWTCPECGHEHGSATMGAFEPEPDLEPSPRSVRPSNRHSACARQDVHGRARPARAGRRPELAWPRSRSSGSSRSSRSRSDCPRWVTRRPRRPRSRRRPQPSLTTTQALCLHLRDLQTPREDALTRLADTSRPTRSRSKPRGTRNSPPPCFVCARQCSHIATRLRRKAIRAPQPPRSANALGAMPC